MAAMPEHEPDGATPARPGAASAPTASAPTALPSVGARVLAFLAILLAGAAGAFIGYAFMDLQCTGDCTVRAGIGAVVGGLVFAGGTAVVVVLTLRAMGEWRTIQANSPDRGGRDPDGGIRRPPRVR